MYQKHVARFAAMAVLAIAGCTGLSAQAQAPAGPTMTMNVTDGTIVHQKDGTVILGMTASDPAGLHSAFISGGYSSVTTYYPAGIPGATVHLYFFAGYYPVGDYKVHCGVVDNNGVRCDREITLHLVK